MKHHLALLIASAATTGICAFDSPKSPKRELPPTCRARVASLAAAARTAATRHFERERRKPEKNKRREERDMKVGIKQP